MKHGRGTPGDTLYHPSYTVITGAIKQVSVLALLHIPSMNQEDTSLSMPMIPQDSVKALINKDLDLLLQFLVSVHVSQPYSSIRSTSDLKI